MAKTAIPDRSSILFLYRTKRRFKSFSISNRKTNTKSCALHVDSTRWPKKNLGTGFVMGRFFTDPGNLLRVSSKYNRKDHLYQKAKEAGYRSRAAYKLKEIQAAYKIIQNGGSVLDVGAWPGGWCQVALEYVGPAGAVWGIDLVAVDPIDDPRCHLITGDARDLGELLPPSTPRFDCVISDMSPKLTGIREADQAGIVACAELALWAAQEFLKQGGNFVVKVFKGNEVEKFVKSARPMFNKLVRSELDSTRNTSNEFYVIGLGFK
jgi:23S rRNA (uridine2552-2'-O)-methyltransferase